MQNQEKGIASSERDGYESTITKLSTADGLQKMLVFIIALCSLAAVVILIFMNISQKSYNEEQLKRQDLILSQQNKLLEEVKNVSVDNQKNIQRIVNYLNCIATTPIEERTRELIQHCFEAATPPELQSNNGDVGDGGISFNNSTTSNPSQSTGQGGSSGSEVASNNGGSRNPSNPPVNNPPANNPPPNNNPPPPDNKPPVNPPPTALEVLTGTLQDLTNTTTKTVNGLTCNRTLMLLCK